MALSFKDSDVPSVSVPHYLPNDWDQPELKRVGKDQKRIKVTFKLPDPEEVGSSLFDVVKVLRSKGIESNQEIKAVLSGYTEYMRGVLNMVDKHNKAYYSASRGVSKKKK